MTESHFYYSCRLEGLQLYQKRLQHRLFSWNFAKFLRIPFLQNKLVMEVLVEPQITALQLKSSGFDEVIFIACIKFFFHSYVWLLLVALRRYLNLHWTMHFPAMCSKQNFKIFRCSGPTKAHSCNTTTTKIIYEFFMIWLWKVDSNPETKISYPLIHTHVYV